VVIIDGVQVKQLHRYRVHSDGCFALYPDQEDEGRPIPMAYSDGYWLLIAPLAPGRHTLTVGARYGAFGGSGQDMIQNFEYVLWVGKERPEQHYVAAADRPAYRYGPGPRQSNSPRR